MTLNIRTVKMDDLDAIVELESSAFHMSEEMTRKGHDDSDASCYPFHPVYPGYAGVFRRLRTAGGLHPAGGRCGHPFWRPLKRCSAGCFPDFTCRRCLPLFPGEKRYPPFSDRTAS